MNTLGWIVFMTVVVFLLVFDLKIIHRKEHVPSVKEAALWSVFWIGLGLCFGWYISVTLGTERGMEYFTGYAVEKSLSIDNLFVFLVLFQFFGVPKKLYHKVLFWGIVGAIIIRGAFIIGGTWLITVFEPLLFVLGAFLIYTGIKIGQAKNEGAAPKKMVEKNPIIKFMNRHFSVTDGYIADKFFVRENKQWFITPLFITLIAIETTDIIFALDSIPAIMGITQDSFIIFTSNIAAILGLRALFFLVEALIGSLHYLKYALSAALVFIGVKMLLPLWALITRTQSVEIPIWISLTVVLGLIVIATVASIMRTQTIKKKGAKKEKEEFDAI